MSWVLKFVLTDALAAARAGVVAGDGSYVMIRTERFGVWGWGFGVGGLGLGGWGWGLGFGVWGLGFGVWGPRLFGDFCCVVLFFTLAQRLEQGVRRCCGGRLE